MEDQQRICCFCSQNEGKYTCPRCNELYCSKTCYQSQAHINCSEQFFKECVEDEMKLENVDDAQKKHMLEILRKFQSEENDDTDSDDDSIPDLSERLQNVDLDDPDEVWRCLSEQEREEFQAILQSGDVGRLIPQYEPWWSKRYEKKVEELESFMSDEKEYKRVCPAISGIVPFNTLSKTEPSPCIMWNIVNVLAAYVFTARRYIGEYQNKDGCNTVLRICTNLNSNQNFEDMDTAIDSVIYQANSHTDITCTSEEANVFRQDVNKILAGPENSAVSYYMLAALSDLQQLFTKIIKMKKDSTESKREFSKRFTTPVVEIAKSKLQNSSRKLVFYTSWINEHYKSKFHLIS